MADYADAILEIINDESLPRAFSGISGAVRHVQKMKEDSEFIKNLEDNGDFSIEQYRAHVAPLISYLDRLVAPVNYYQESDKDMVEHKRDCPAGLWVIEDNFLLDKQRRRYKTAEDLYKLREDIATYEKWRKNQPDPGDEVAFSMNDSFDTRVAQQRRKDKNKKSFRKEFSDLQKQGSQEPHVVIYDGPEGKIVVPQTMKSSQYWGANTRWCISAIKKRGQCV